MIPLNRALSKLGILSRTQATTAILAGRVRVDGRVVMKPTTIVDPARARISVDHEARSAAPWRTLLLYKPRGVVTTRRDPEGRPTVFSLLGGAAEGLVAVGRLDLATTGVLLLTTDTALADALTDPVNAVPRVYIVTVRGKLTEADAAALTHGVNGMHAHSVLIRKTSSRESHATIELHEGKNREVRRLFAAVGHDVTRLKRVRFGGLELGELEPGAWREISRDELADAFPALPVIDRDVRATNPASYSRAVPTRTRTPRSQGRSRRSTRR